MRKEKEESSWSFLVRLHPHVELDRCLHLTHVVLDIPMLGKPAGPKLHSDSIDSSLFQAQREKYIPGVSLNAVCLPNPLHLASEVVLPDGSKKQSTACPDSLGTAQARHCVHLSRGNACVCVQ